LLDVVLVDWLQQVVAHIGTMAVDDDDEEADERDDERQIAG